MKKLIYIPIIFLSFISLNTFSQKDLLADQKSFGLTFLDGQKYPECQMCNLKGDEKTQIDDVEQKIEGLSPENKVAKLQELLSNDYADNVKARIAITIARIKYEEIISDDQMNYNLNESGYISLSEKEIDGTLDVLSWFDKAINFATDDGSKSYIKRGRMQYISKGGIYDAIIDDMTIYENSITENITQLRKKPDQKRILQLLNEDYVETGYNPFHSYTGVNTGLIYSYGKDAWIGGNIGITFVENKNVFQNIVRLSALSFSWQHNLNTSSNDISFDVFKFDQFAFFNINITQFGFHQGLPGVDGVKWFYRPEIGLSYGPFSVSYAYNLTFDKDVRSLTEKNMLVVKLSYPLVRISRYD